MEDGYVTFYLQDSTICTLLIMNHCGMEGMVAPLNWFKPHLPVIYNCSVKGGSSVVVFYGIYVCFGAVFTLRTCRQNAFRYR